MNSSCRHCSLALTAAAGTRRSGQHPCLLHLVADVQLVGVEEEQDEIASGRKPATDFQEVVRSLDPLLLSAQNAGSVDQRDLVQQWAGALSQFELCQESVPILRQPLQKAAALTQRSFSNCHPLAELVCAADDGRGPAWKGLSGCTMRVLPGVRRSSMPLITTTKRSVVGSGPMLMPGYSRFRRCFTNVVFPAPKGSRLGPALLECSGLKRA